MFRSFSLVALILSASASVAAHFTLDFPQPRGVLVSDMKSTFVVVGLFDDTSFVLAGVLLSTAQNPTSFDNFKTAGGEDQVVRGWATEEDGGTFCIPLSLNNTGISGVESGGNITIQIVLQATDGALYQVLYDFIFQHKHSDDFQCADLTLSDTFTINEACTNSTTSGHGEHGDSDDSESDGTGALSPAVASLAIMSLVSILVL
ncbi:hypothetical protein CPB85DRAFT_1267010 [Mucidula mucida]|nr:hypothetical protein CPB85DRAFT_1267010 [Mucidula mucida]